jgi:hypothetical protein
MPKRDRNYRKEYDTYHAKPEQIARRAARNKSVADLGRKGKSSKDGKEVHHKDNNPKNRSKKNMAVISRKRNRELG